MIIALNQLLFCRHGNGEQHDQIIHHLFTGQFIPKIFTQSVDDHQLIQQVRQLLKFRPARLAGFRARLALGKP